MLEGNVAKIVAKLNYTNIVLTKLILGNSQ